MQPFIISLAFQIHRGYWYMQASKLCLEQYRLLNRLDCTMPERRFITDLPEGYPALGLIKTFKTTLCSLCLPF